MRSLFSFAVPLRGLFRFSAVHTLLLFDNPFNFFNNLMWSLPYVGPAIPSKHPALVLEERLTIPFQIFLINLSTKLCIFDVSIKLKGNF